MRRSTLSLGAIALVVALLSGCGGAIGGAGGRSPVLHVVVKAAPGSLTGMTRPMFGLGSPAILTNMTKCYTKGFVPDRGDNHTAHFDVALSRPPIVSADGTMQYCLIVFDDINGDGEWHANQNPSEPGQAWRTGNGYPNTLKFWPGNHRVASDWLISGADLGSAPIDANDYTVQFSIYVP